MTTVNTIEDLVQVMDQNPEWVEALRARLLTRELLELPQTVAELVATVSEVVRRLDGVEQGQASLGERQTQLEERQARLEENQARLTESVARLEASHAELAQRLTELAEAMARMETRQDRMQDDLGWLKGRIIYDIVRSDAALIADDMGFVWEKSLVRADLRRLTERHDVSDLPRGEVRSFQRADLVMQVSDADGAESYIAVEASFTANGRDSRRALRNAELLTRFTGLPARAAIAGARYDWNLKEPVESEELHWYEIPSEDLETE